MENQDGEKQAAGKPVGFSEGYCWCIVIAGVLALVAVVLLKIVF
jgi:hypothetical protein